MQLMMPYHIPTLPILIERLVEFSHGDLSATLEALPEIQLHAYLNAPISNTETTYPVLIFTNGMVSIPTFYSQQFEELASYGYIVVVVTHTYYVNFLTAQLVVDDIVFTLNQLETLNTADPENIFTGRFNLDQIGIIGHSLGGRIAINAAVEDNRIKVGISEDGVATPSVNQLTQPFVFMQAENDQDKAFSSSLGPAYLFTAEGFGHGSFVDQVLWPARGESPIFGTIDGRRALAIVNAYVLAFFNQYLKGQDQELLQGASDDFPEVTIHSRNLGAYPQ